MASRIVLALAIPGVLGAASCAESKPAEAPFLPGAIGSAPAGPDPVAPSAAVAASAGPAAMTSPSAAPAASTSAPLASVMTTDASTVQRLFESTSRAPVAALHAKGDAAEDALAKGLREVAKRAAPGMEPDGALATGTLKEKQDLQTDVTLQPGRCYAIVGYSKKVKDLDLYLLLAPGILSGQDATDDSTPVIGGPPQPMCPVARTPVTYKLAIVADEGAGDIVVQLYSRPK
jgi:hypothetical protein